MQMLRLHGVSIHPVKGTADVKFLRIGYVNVLLVDVNTVRGRAGGRRGGGGRAGGG